MQTFRMCQRVPQRVAQATAPAPRPRMLLAGLMALTIAWAAARAPAQGVAAEPAHPARPQPAVGKPFGDLVLPTLDGSSSVDLDVYRGRKVLLIEFASW